jgi:hypothetical protein
MARVTYNDPSGVAETVKWHGREHKAGEPVDVEDAPENQAYLDAAEANPFFTVEDRQELQQEGDNSPSYEIREQEAHAIRARPSRQAGRQRAFYSRVTIAARTKPRSGCKAMTLGRSCQFGACGGSSDFGSSNRPALPRQLIVSLAAARQWGSRRN